MSFLRDALDDFPSGDRLQLLMAAGVTGAAVLVGLLFVVLLLMPQLRARGEQMERLEQAEQALIMTRMSPAPDLEEGLATQLAARRAELDEAAAIFFADAQAATLFDDLYSAAERSNVDIVSLQTVEDNTDDKSAIYDVNSFRLQVFGPVAALLDFVSRIERAASPSFVVDDFSIEATEGLPILELGFSIYTSPFSPRDVAELPPEPGPSPTPRSLPELERALEAATIDQDWEAALRILRQIGIVSPDYPELEDRTYRAYLERGYELLDQGDLDGASTHFNLALSLRPTSSEAMAGLARVAFTPTPTLTIVQRMEADLDAAWARGDWAEVIAILRQIETLDPGFDGLVEKLYAAHVNYGHTLAGRGELVEAREAFSRALEINPQGGEAAEGLRRLAGDLGLPPPQPPQPDAPEGPGFTTYVVQRNDTLFSIARRYNTSVDAIMAANGLTSRSIIHAGLVLRIPVE